MSDWKNVQYKDGKMRTSSGGGGGGSSTLAGLDDVDLNNLQDGQIIKWDATNQKFINANESGGDSTTFEIVTDTWTYDNGTTVTLSLTKSYTNPYVFPVNCLPTQNWNNGARVVVQTSTISYNSTNDEISFKVYVSSTQQYTCDWLIIDLG